MEEPRVAAEAERPAFVSRNMRVFRRNSWIFLLALAPYFVLAWAGEGPFSASDLLWPGLMSLPVLLLLWWMNPWPRSSEAAVRADMRGVEIGGHRIPRARILDGFIVPRRPYRVLLRRRFGLPIEFELGSQDEGRAMLRALGLDATQTVATFHNRRSGLVWATMNLPMLFLVKPVVADAHRSGFDFILTLFYAFTILGMLTEAFARVTIGADGVVLSRRGKRLFIGYGEIEAVQREVGDFGLGLGLWLTLRSGKKVPLPTVWRDKETCAVIEERIWEAMEAFADKEGSDAAVLRRGSRTVPEWITSLRAVGAGANADHRTAPFPRERLLRIVEDPTAPADDRAAAAVALGASVDDDDRARLLRIADMVAAPRLRVAIEAAASSDDAELEAALAEVVDEATNERVLTRG